MIVNKIDRKNYDCIIIGGGGAGLRAAYTLAKSNHKVAVVSKVYPSRSHTCAAQGGINAAVGNAGQHKDDWRFHMYDTVMGSDFLGDQKAIEYMCKEAPDAILELERMGMPFSRDDNGRIYQRSFGGQTVNYGGEIAKRTCAVADRTGHALLHTLYQQCLSLNVNFYSEWFAIDLVRAANGHVVGVVAMDLETSALQFMKSHFTVLATGGAGRIFKSSTNAYTCTGDGLAMAYRLDLPLQDMEMWQFHPTGIFGVGILVSEGTRGEGGYLVNGDNERFMPSYAPHFKDLACRDFVSRCSMIEIREGRGCGPNKDHVGLQLSHLPKAVFKEKLPGITELSRVYANIDPMVDPIPVVPTCHYMMGGIPTNKDAEVVDYNLGSGDQVVPGLYACGEVANVSVHGANRLGANSLLDLVIFGRSAGQSIKDKLDQGVADVPVSDDDVHQAIQRFFEFESNHNSGAAKSVSELRVMMQEIMQNDFGVFRTEISMKTGLEKLKQLDDQIRECQLVDKSKSFNTARVELLELDNLMKVAISTAKSAVYRTESRGAHSREDYQSRNDDSWHCHTIDKIKMDPVKRPVDMSPEIVDAIPLRERAQ